MSGLAPAPTSPPTVTSSRWSREPLLGIEPHTSFDRILNVCAQRRLQLVQEPVVRYHVRLGVRISQNFVVVGCSADTSRQVDGSHLSHRAPKRKVIGLQHGEPGVRLPDRGRWVSRSTEEGVAVVEVVEQVPEYLKVEAPSALTGSKLSRSGFCIFGR